MGNGKREQSNMAQATNTARARNTDPATSHAAAADVTPRVAPLRDRVVRIFSATEREFTHDGLIAEYRRQSLALGWPAASDSSIRTRCNELVKAGVVEQVPDEIGRSRFGRVSLLWRLVVQSKETTGADTLDGAA